MKSIIKNEIPKILDNIYYWGIKCVDFKEIFAKIKKANRNRSFDYKKDK